MIKALPLIQALLNMFVASPHRLCAGYMTTSTFLLARSAGDAALDSED
jgi:hypothetical protein